MTRLVRTLLASTTLALFGCEPSLVVGRLGAAPDLGVDLGDLGDASDGGLGNDGCTEPLVADAIATGEVHACAIRTGEVFCWGGREAGQRCDGESSLEPPQELSRPFGFDTYEAVYAGGMNTCLLRTDDVLLCCGDNFSGTLADGTSQGSAFPVEVVSTIADLTIGFANVYATHMNGAMSVWGDDEAGQLGLGDASPGAAVRAVTALPDESFVSLGAAAQHACGVTAEGALRCAGSNGSYELGLPFSPDVNVFTPVPAPTTFRRVSAGRRLSCAIVTDDALYCWGANTPTMIPGHDGEAEYPMRVGDGNDYEEISAGFDHVCALRDGGRLFCWGNGASGQLGFEASSVDAPTEVSPGVLYRAVSASRDFTCAIRAADSVVVCFGDDSSGQVAGRTEGGPRAVCRPL